MSSLPVKEEHHEIKHPVCEICGAEMVEIGDEKAYDELFFPLLDYVNREYHILPEEDYFGQGMIDPQDAAEVAHFLWERTWIIDDYLERSDLPEEHMEILKSWKGCITGRFIIERHLKKGSVFISIDDNSVFLVNGIVSSWEEMLRNTPMPTLLDATLLPFKNAIISDGLVSFKGLTFNGLLPLLASQVSLLLPLAVLSY